jgi:hypothetical protein
MRSHNREDAMKIVGSVILVTAACAFVLKLIGGPLYARYTADECKRAYSRAHTFADSGRVDLHPYQGTSNLRRSYCSEIRGAAMTRMASIPVLDSLIKR